MAYATIAGLPVQAGLYVATVPMLVYTLAGSSRPLSVSTTSTLAALTAAAVAVAARATRRGRRPRPPCWRRSAGRCWCWLGCCGSGSRPTSSRRRCWPGFKAGTGLLIAAGQLGKVLGVPQEGDSFFGKLGSALSHLGEVSWPTVGLAAGSIAILLGLRRYAPMSVPGPLIVVALGILLAAATGLADRGVALVGEIPPGLPADQELRALGVANLAGGCFQAFAAGGGLSQTAVNRETGARSQLAGVVTAGVVVLTLLFLTPLFENLPQATPGAVVIVAVAGLVDLPDDETVPGLMVIRPVASIYFANAPRVRRRGLDLIDSAGRAPRWCCWTSAPSPTSTSPPRRCCPASTPTCAGGGSPLWLANLNARPLDMIRRLPDAAAWEWRLFRELDDAVATFAARS